VVQAFLVVVVGVAPSPAVLSPAARRENCIDLRLLHQRYVRRFVLYVLIVCACASAASLFRHPPRDVSPVGSRGTAEQSEDEPYHNVKAQWLAYGVFFACCIGAYACQRLFLLNQSRPYACSACSRCRSACAGVLGASQSRQGFRLALGLRHGDDDEMQTQDASKFLCRHFMLNNSLDHLPLLWEPSPNRAGIVLRWRSRSNFARSSRIMFRGGSPTILRDHDAAMLSAWYTLILDIQPYTNGANALRRRLLSN